MITEIILLGMWCHLFPDYICDISSPSATLRHGARFVKKGHESSLILTEYSDSNAVQILVELFLLPAAF